MSKWLRSLWWLLLTLGPRLVHTSNPSPAPTTPLPTPDPTIRCSSGYYYNFWFGSCTICAAGRYTDTTDDPKPVSCDWCSSGRYQSEQGQSSCDECPSGKYSIEYDRTYCEACSAGTYVNSSYDGCLSCSPGRYSPVALDNNCLECSAGFSTRVAEGAATCTACGAGTFSKKNSVNCTTCPAGTRSGVMDTECTNCTAGSFAADAGSSLCIECPSGTHQPVPGSTECLNCSIGRYAGSTGLSECEVSLEGYYVPGMSMAYSLPCPEGKYSTEGADTCSLCYEKFYMDASGSECIECTVGMVCDKKGTTYTTIGVEDGYYKFSSTSTSVYECPYAQTCARQKGNANATGSSCATHAQGHLCSVCAESYYLTTEGCLACSRVENAWLGPLMLAGFMMLAGVSVWTVSQHQELKKRVSETLKDNQLSIVEGTEKATQLFITTQIILMLHTHHQELGGRSVAEPYLGFLNGISFLSMDVVEFVPFHCFVKGSAEFNHMAALVTECSVPIVLIAFIQLYRTVKAIGLRVQQRRSSLSKHEEHHTNVITMAMTVLFFILPVISRRICKSYRCNTYDGGDDGDYKLLVADPSINCESDTYTMMMIFATVSILIYPVGCPLALLVLLAPHRHRLNPKQSTDGAVLSEEEVVALRREDPLLKMHRIVDFAMIYRPQYWWYEVYNMVRRLALSCFVYLFNSLGHTTTFVVIVSILTCAFERECRPQINKFLGIFIYLLHWEVICFIQYMLLLDADMASDNAVALAIVMLISNIFLACIVFFGSSARNKVAKSVGQAVKMPRPVRAVVSRTRALTGLGGGGERDAGGGVQSAETGTALEPRGLERGRSVHNPFGQGTGEGTAQTTEVPKAEREKTGDGLAVEMVDIGNGDALESGVFESPITGVTTTRFTSASVSR